jgi:hypothetical protein
VVKVEDVPGKVAAVLTRISKLPINGWTSATAALGTAGIRPSVDTIASRLAYGDMRARRMTSCDAQRARISLAIPRVVALNCLSRFRISRLNLLSASLLTVDHSGCRSMVLGTPFTSCSNSVPESRSISEVLQSTPAAAPRSACVDHGGIIQP